MSKPGGFGRRAALAGFSSWVTLKEVPKDRWESLVMLIHLNIDIWQIIWFQRLCQCIQQVYQIYAQNIDILAIEYSTWKSPINDDKCRFENNKLSLNWGIVRCHLYDLWHRCTWIFWHNVGKVNPLILNNKPSPKSQFCNGQYKPPQIVDSFLGFPHLNTFDWIHVAAI